MCAHKARRVIRGIGQVHPVSLLKSCCSETSMVSRKGTGSPAGVKAVVVCSDQQFSNSLVLPREEEHVNSCSTYRSCWLTGEYSLFSKQE